MTPRPTHLIAAVAAAAAVALALPGPTPGPADATAARADAATPTRADEPGSPPGAASMIVAQFAFPTISVAAGGTVEVSNADGAPHTVTGAGFNIQVDGGGIGSFVAPDTPGDHAFQCLIHPSMQGVLVVT